ncbi:hypothetical protein CAPTEDRAFT_228121 [Capitella teleta]|uniref:G-protein coupled receptors family 1 profile domain-containing protein n=1 Tax=Capitella teleta TaxID=283909 RepID=R7UP15_CAPTE|nr:hypothetical protein CAPTEDRAFT_228121 [Capitella teleta]|eukprot:ELU05116.1 hypothetical protein CAPTEDRAFT_228121 [Capitella teleta]
MLMHLDALNTSVHVMNVSELSKSEQWLHHALFNIRMCFLPIIVAGTVTNLLNFVVLSHKEMRTLSTSVYLFALAMADLGVMYIELFRVWFEWMNIVRPEVYFTDTYCKMANYTNGVVRDFSNWLIACLTFERLVMVASPYRAKDLCTVRTAKIVTLVLLLVISVSHLHWLVYSVALKNVRFVCWEDPNSRAASLLSALVEFLVGYIVVVVVFIMNLILVTMIYRRQLPCLSAAAASACTPGALAQGKRASYNKRLTRTLLLVAIVFLVCETPRIIMSFICRFLSRTPIRRIILNVAFVVSGVNHAANFFIYILSSPRFRQLLLQSLPTKNFHQRRKARIRLERVCCHHDITCEHYHYDVSPNITTRDI